MVALLIISFLFGIVPLSATAYGGWSEVYKDFVLNGKYLRMDYGPDIDEIPFGGTPAFVLHDMDSDGVPELIADNGCEFAAGWLSVVYQYDSANDAVRYVGIAGILSPAGCHATASGYPGIYCYNGRSGFMEGVYYTIKNGGLVDESVLSTQEEYDADTDSYNVIYRQETADNALYQVFKDENNLEPLEYRSIEEILSMGWDLFAAKYDTSPAVEEKSEGVPVESEDGKDTEQTDSTMNEGDILNRLIIAMDQVVSDWFRPVKAYIEEYNRTPKDIAVSEIPQKNELENLFLWLEFYIAFSDWDENHDHNYNYQTIASTEGNMFETLVRMPILYKEFFNDETLNETFPDNAWHIYPGSGSIYEFTDYDSDSLPYKSDKLRIDFIMSHILHCSQSDFEKLKSRAFNERDDYSGGLVAYESDGYYYGQSFDIGWEGGWESVKILSAKYDGTYYYISYSPKYRIEEGPEEYMSTNDSYYATVALEEYDGKNYWTIYGNSPKEFVVFNETEWGT